MKAKRLEIKPISHPCPCCGQAVKEPPPFTPVVLTLETEEEAKFLYHLLNNASGASFNTYIELQGLNFNLGVGSIKTRIWTKLCSVFP